MHMGYRQSGLLIGCKFIREREREMSSFEIFNSFVRFFASKGNENKFILLFIQLCLCCVDSIPDDLVVIVLSGYFLFRQSIFLNFIADCSML